MTVRTEFPRPIRSIDHAWIPLADGTRLAARIWLPEDAEADPVPAILEYLPYRKGDAMVVRDARHHAYFAGHGYAAVRVDLRGSGDSDGGPARRRCSTALGRDDWRTRVETDSRMTATASGFLVTHTLGAYEGEERVLARTWTLTFARDGV